MNESEKKNFFGGVNLRWSLAILAAILVSVVSTYHFVGEQSDDGLPPCVAGQDEVCAPKQWMNSYERLGKMQDEINKLRNALQAGVQKGWQFDGNAKFTKIVPPLPPAGLAAAAGNAQVALTWKPSTNATSYNVKRSTTNGSGYSTIASPTGPAYTDATAANGTTYYYVVSAVSDIGEGANTGSVSATPKPATPPKK